MAVAAIPKKITDTSPNAAGTALSAKSVGGLAGFDGVVVLATITGGTGGAIDVYLQGSFDDGVTWHEVAHFPQVAAATTKTFRITFGSTSGAAAGATQVGTGTAGSAGTAVLAANTVVDGHPGDLVRAVYVAGASTSAGATQTLLFYGLNSWR